MWINRRFPIYITLCLSLLWNIGVIAGESEGKSAMYQMAEIMHRLKHFPSPLGKETLKSIIDNKSTSNNERILATAIMNLEHKALDEDVPKLRRIIEDKSASADEHDMAEIIVNLNHRPTSEDKQRLKMMMK